MQDNQKKLRNNFMEYLLYSCITVCLCKEKTAVSTPTDHTHYYNMCREKGSESSDQLFVYRGLIYIVFKITLTADPNSPNPFRGTHCISHFFILWPTIPLFFCPFVLFASFFPSFSPIFLPFSPPLLKNFPICFEILTWQQG